MSISVPVPESSTLPWAASNYSLPSASSLFAKAQGSSSWLATTAAIVASLLILEQTVYRYKKGHLPGSSWTIPIIGKFADSLHPTLENYKKQWDSGALSVVSVFNIFIVMASTNEYSRKILTSPTYAEPCLVHSAKAVLRPENWVFLSGPEHVAYRKVLNTLFTRKALGIYVTIQDAIARKHLKQWLETAKKEGGSQAIMFTARAMNMDTSLRVFCGKHIAEADAQEINERYWQITKALELVNFPLALPGTKVYKAIQSRKIAMKVLTQAAHDSKIYVANGGEPECMLDQWNAIMRDPAYTGRREFSDDEQAMVILSFLFASQDAMSSGLIYGFQHLADHPEILQKLREEQERVRAGDYESPLTLEQMDEMPYLTAVVKESLRVKPPVTMVPYKCTKPFKIANDYVVPANSMLIPSFYNSLHDPVVFPDPSVFNPDRWLDPNSSANANPKNYMVWGAGIHKCIGNEYATMNIALTLGIAAMMMDFEHDITPESEQVQIIATLFPQDGCRLKMTPRA